MSEFNTLYSRTHFLLLTDLVNKLVTECVAEPHYNAKAGISNTCF